jgi:murein DD-endopeptidase MepM/ murein hydrolase activator NlpD
LFLRNFLQLIIYKVKLEDAVYFAGKSPLPKGAKQREVLAWLKSLGLTFEQIHDHREKVLEKINETINLPGVEEEYPYVYIDAVDQDFVLDDEDEEEDFEEDLEGLDDLLNFVRSDADEPVEEIADDIEEEIVEAVDEDDEEDFGSEDDIPDELLQDDVDPELIEKLLVTINKPKKESSYTTNKKIFDSIVSNFGRIQSTLDTVNRNLENQNELIKASIETQLAIGELISNQSSILSDKFDLILKQFEMKNALSEKQADDEKKNLDEQRLEAQRDAAGIADFQDLTKQPGKKKRENKIEKYLKARLTRKLYRRLPKSVRRARQKVRNLQRLPGKAKGKVVSKITSMLPSKGKQAAGALSKIRGMGGAGRVMGPARYVFAGLEYSERKQAGQSEVQALSGVGSGLAGAAAGGWAGAKAGMALGGAIGALFGGVGAGPGAAIGGILGGLVGSIGGGMAGGGLSDTITGAHETGTGLTKPGATILHGTEAVINQNAPIDMSPMNTMGGIMIASTTQYINSVGPIASPIAPTFKGMASQMAKQYDVPSTLAQTNVGGSLPNLGAEMKKVREKRKQTPEGEFFGKEQDLLNTQDEDSFAEKLLKMIDPEGKFETVLKNLNRGTFMMGPDNYDGTGIDGDLKGNIVNPMEGGVMQDYPGAKFGAPRSHGTHKGRDIVGPAGMKVVSALPGTVTSVINIGKLPGGGWSKGIYVKHSNGMETRYLHVHPSVKVGDTVKAGQQIAKITEMDDISSVPHLHFEVIVNGQHVNPEPIVRGSLKLSDIASGKVPGLSVNAPKNPAEIENYSGTEAPKTTPPSAQSPSTTRPQSVSTALPKNATPITQTQRVAKTERLNSEKLVASAMMDMKPPEKPKTNLTNQVSAPPARQKTIEKSMEIASLSYDNEQQSNDMLLINNQQSQMPSVGSNQPPMIIDMGGKSPSEILKNIMMQRLSA